MPDLKTGRVLLSRFALVRLLGHGDVGQVWLARDHELETTIAIKVLNPRLASDPDRIDRLKNECRDASKLIHPNIVHIFDFHPSDDIPFISMAYIDGEDLDAHRHRFGVLSYPDVITLMRPIIGALSYAHGMGLVHRDVKGANVLVDRQNAPHVTDFGMAGVLPADADSANITAGGAFCFMSPQQLAGNKPHPSDDVYALGVLMHELLTGYPPFYPEITPEKIHGTIPPGVNQTLAQLKAEDRIPGSLDQIIAGMLAKARDERPGSMEEIDLALQQILDSTPGQTAPPAMRPRIANNAPSMGGMAEIIRPVKMSRQDVRLHRAEPRRRYFLIVSILVFALAAMLAGGGYLLRYLSKNPVHVTDIPQTQGTPAPHRENSGVEKPVGEDEPLPPGITDPAQHARDKEDAEQKLADFLRAKKALDDKGGADWGGALYKEMMGFSREADAFFIDQDYVSASREYAQALAKGKALAGQAADALRRLLDEGRVALAAGDGERARQKFSVALLIDPENDTARRNLERAKNLEAVLRLIASGKGHEQQNNLSFAYADYQGALQLDPESDEARMALIRVKEKITEAQFQELMSSGLTAFHNNDYDLARAILLKAKSFKPDAVVVRDALAQVDQAIRLARIQILRQEALVAEQSEDWEQALRFYMGVLEIDATLQFAALGRERCLEQIRIAKHIHFYLENPHVLESERHLDDALQLVKEASSFDPKGPQLVALLEKLDHLVKAAQKTVRITLTSDNLTDVAVYKVGKFGRFESLELNLRPGTYTVVGTRSGYKDIRQVIVIKAGQAPLQVSVKCREKI